MSTTDSLSARAQQMFEVIERYRSSGLTQKAFCQAEALRFSTFQYWRSRYNEYQKPALSKAEGSNGFVEVRPPSGRPRRQAATDVATVLTYPNGVTVSLGPSAPLSLLKELISLRPAHGTLL